MNYYKQHKLIENSSDAREFADRIAKAELISLDIETSGLNEYTATVLLIQVAMLDEQGNPMCYVVNATQPILHEVLPHLVPALQDEKVKVLGHNLAFEYKWFVSKFNCFITNMWDSMVIEAVLTMGKYLRVNLKEVASRRLNYDLDKDIRQGFIGRDKKETFSQQEIEYAVLDVNILFDIYNQQKKEVNELKLNTIAEIENRVIPVTSLMEHYGWEIDTPRLSKLIEDEEQSLLNVLMDIQDKSGKDIPVQLDLFNDRHYIIQSMINALGVNSPDKVIKILRKSGIDVEDSKKLTLAKLKGNEIVDAITKYRETYKLLSSFLYVIRDKIHPVTGKLHPSFLQVPVLGEKMEYGSDGGATTGRYASNNPNCFSDDTEILTPKGFVKFSDLVEGEEVTQYNHNGTTEAVVPISHHRYSYKTNPKLFFGEQYQTIPKKEIPKIVRIESDFVVVECTHNHRIVTKADGLLWKFTAGTWMNVHQKTGKINHKFVNLEGDVPVKNLRITEIAYDRYVYCVTVPSGMIVIRKEGKISVQGNCQNIPARNDLRECFIARKGKKIITADYSGCEIIIALNLSRDKELIEFYKGGGDLHGLIASKIFNLPYDDCKKWVDKNGDEQDPKYKKQRKLAKFAVFG